MSIEIFEEKVKNRKFDEEKQAKSPKEVKEEKEKQNAVNEAVRICAEYHEKLDPTGYFGRAAAKVSADLLPGFLKIKKNLLPESLQNVFTHRMVYLTMMSELKKEDKLLSLLDHLAPRLFGSMGLFDKDFNAVFAECKKYPKFKELTSDDFKKAYSIITSGVKHLQSVTKANANWQNDAKKYLQNKKSQFVDKRVDDMESAKNLHAGLQTAAKNLRMLEIKTQSKSA